MNTIIVICLLIIIIIGLLVLVKLCNGKFKLGGGYIFNDSCIISCINGQVYLKLFKDMYPFMLNTIIRSNNINTFIDKKWYLLYTSFVYNETVLPPTLELLGMRIYNQNGKDELVNIIDGYFDDNQNRVIYTSQYNNGFTLQFDRTHLRSNRVGYHKATTVMLDNNACLYYDNGDFIEEYKDPTVDISASIKETMFISDIYRRYNKLSIDVYVNVLRQVLPDNRSVFEFDTAQAIHKKIEFTYDNDVFIYKGRRPDLSYIYYN